jgi:hypothetical protein
MIMLILPILAVPPDKKQNHECAFAHIQMLMVNGY